MNMGYGYANSRFKFFKEMEISILSDLKKKISQLRIPLMALAVIVLIMSCITSFPVNLQITRWVTGQVCMIVSYSPIQVFMVYDS